MKRLPKGSDLQEVPAFGTDNSADSQGRPSALLPLEFEV